jgi:DNA-binding SARP family transcriptional activator
MYSMQDSTPHKVEAHSDMVPMRMATCAMAPALRLRVLCGFEARVDGKLIKLPSNVERVLAFLAIRNRPQYRATVASTLWLDSTEERAAANLRTALWKARQCVGEFIQLHGAQLSLNPGVHTDLVDLMNRTRRLLGDGGLQADDSDPIGLDGDLLPDWDEEWIIFERERMRQLRIHALEALCHKLSLSGHPGPAIDAGLAAVAAEPLRESAQRVLIEAHLREGNIAEARRQYHLYRELLWDSLGIEPSNLLRGLIGVTNIQESSMTQR